MCKDCKCKSDLSLILDVVKEDKLREMIRECLSFFMGDVISNKKMRENEIKKMLDKYEDLMYDCICECDRH